MRPPSPSAPSPLARREALRRQLAAALQQRDGGAVQRLSNQWAHRQGVAALEPLMLELAGAGGGPGDPSQPELLAWWRQLLRQPVPPAAAMQPQPAAAAIAPTVPPVSEPPVIPEPPAAAAPAGLPPAGQSSPGPGARVLPFPPAPARRRPAPGSPHPDLASLRAWLAPPQAPDTAAAPHPQELDRAA